MDKTEKIFDLVNNPKGVYFLSRPRRFGKSLLISTLNEIFEGNKELFKGLWIYKADYAWEKHPVVRIYFSKSKARNGDELINYIVYQLDKTAQLYGITLEQTQYDIKFDELLTRLSGINKVVVLIDEYDKPIIDNIENKELAIELREILKGFYTIIKACDEYIRFVLLTGVSKFSKAGVFSGLNNLKDLSMGMKYSSLLGITREEMEDSFKDHIDWFAETESVSNAELIKKITYWYDGFCFSGTCEKVFNPFSMLLLFDNARFSNYWFESATPSFLIKLMKERDFDIMRLPFLPYYGLKVLAKGYHTVRKTIMKGNEIYVVSDLDGKPLFSITEGCDIDFRPIIIRAADKIISLGINRPVLVFDRGGYGVHFFSQLSTRADFVTWAKYVKKDELKNLEYTSCLMFNGKRYLIAEKTKLIRESISTAIKEGRTEATSTEVRMVVFKELDKDRPVAIYTSNQEKPAPDIAAYMLSRWGESENFFKEIMSLYNFNYHPGYDLKELEEQPLINNPEVKTIKKTIKGIKQKMGQLALAKQETESKIKIRKDIRLENKLNNLQKEIDEYNKELEAFHAKLKEMPDKVSIIEVLRGRPMNKADLEKKKIYDLIQMIAFHSREHLISLFRSCYDDPRDVKQILTKVTKLAGYVKLAGNTLIVLLDWIEDKKHRKAAIKFCHLINSMSPKLKARMEFKLYFRISSIPQGTIAVENKCTI